MSSDTSLEEVFKGGILNSVERDELKKHEVHIRPTVMLQWAALVVQQGCNKADEKGAAMKMTDDLTKIQVLQQEVADTMRLQVPFQYFHLLSIMIVINLTLWAYAMALTRSWFAPPVYAAC